MKTLSKPKLISKRRARAGVSKSGICIPRKNETLKPQDKVVFFLDQGEIYAVPRIGSKGSRVLPSIRIAADDSLNQNVWYDELVVKDETAYVIGYRQEPASEEKIFGVVELHSFKLENNRVIRLETVYLESHELVHSRYGSGLVEGKLGFYIPHRKLVGQEPIIPYYLSYEAGQFRRSRPLFEREDVFIAPSKRRVESPHLHTLMLCELSNRGEVSCKAKSILGDWFHEIIFSPSQIEFRGEENTYVLNGKLMTLNAR